MKIIVSRGIAEYIIKVKTKTNGKWVNCYHSDILKGNDEAMNVYCESLTTNESKAKVFYMKTEAEKVSKLFNHQYSKHFVIPATHKIFE